MCIARVRDGGCNCGCAGMHGGSSIIESRLELPGSILRPGALFDPDRRFVEH